MGLNWEKFFFFGYFTNHTTAISLIQPFYKLRREFDIVWDIAINKINLKNNFNHCSAINGGSHRHFPFHQSGQIPLKIKQTKIRSACAQSGRYLQPESPPHPGTGPISGQTNPNHVPIKINSKNIPNQWKRHLDQKIESNAVVKNMEN